MTAADVKALCALIRRMAEADILSEQALALLRKAHFAKIAARMVVSAGTYGRAHWWARNAAPGFGIILSRNIDNDLEAQIKIVSEAFDLYLKAGEVPAPYYPYRIAVIARKAELREEEQAFLAAWCRHFSNRVGGTYERPIDRTKRRGPLNVAEARSKR
jgi:hypothetical protein